RARARCRARHCRPPCQGYACSWRAFLLLVVLAGVERLVSGITNAGYRPAVIPRVAPSLSEAEGSDLCGPKAPRYARGDSCDSPFSDSRYSTRRPFFFEERSEGSVRFPPPGVTSGC